jgi:hypothetical protein
VRKGNPMVAAGSRDREKDCFLNLGKSAAM